MAKIENLYRPCPKPTIEEVMDYACSLAKADGKGTRLILELIRWPSWVTPPEASPRMQETWLIHGEYVKKLKEKAKATLTEDMAKLPREKIKRHKRVPKPNKSRYWTKWPLKHGQTPPRRNRGFTLRQPLPTRRILAPPGEHAFEELPAVGPSRQEREILLFPGSGDLRTG